MDSVHIVSYTHRHGVDLSCYPNEKTAFIGAAQIIADNLDEINEVDILDNISEAINEGEFEAAFDIWAEADTGKKIEINNLAICHFVKHPKIKCVNCDKVLKTFMTDDGTNLVENFGCPDCDS